MWKYYKIVNHNINSFCAQRNMNGETKYFVSNKQEGMFYAKLITTMLTYIYIYIHILISI